MSAEERLAGVLLIVRFNNPEPGDDEVSVCERAADVARESRRRVIHTRNHPRQTPGTPMNARIAFLITSLFLFCASSPSCQAAVQIVSAVGIANGTSVGVTFDGPLDSATAGAPANYVLSGGLTCTDAVLR